MAEPLRGRDLPAREQQIPPFISYTGKLTVIKLRIESIACQQIFMIALFNDPAIFHDQNNIRILNGGKPVRHNETGPSLHQLGKSILDLLLRSRIDRRGRLVQNQHSRYVEHDPGDTKQLFLSLTHTCSVLGDPGVKPLRHLLDEAVRMGFFGRLYDLLIGISLIAKSDVLPDSSCFQPGILENHAIGTPETFPGNVADVCTVHLNGPVIDIVKAHEEIDDRRLPASGRAHNGHPLSLADLEVKVFDELFARLIRKLHMRKGHISFHIRQNLRILRIRRLRRLIDELKDSGRAGKGILQFCHHT